MKMTIGSDVIKHFPETHSAQGKLLAGPFPYLSQNNTKTVVHLFLAMQGCAMKGSCYSAIGDYRITESTQASLY